LPHLLDGRRRSLAVIEALLVGMARNIEHLQAVADQDAARVLAAFEEMLLGAEFSEERLRGGLADAERVKGRIGAAISAFAVA
jgi:hypothetical protein